MGDELQMIKSYYPVATNVCIIIYDVIYDIEDKIKFSWNICDKVKKTRYPKIRYEKEGRSYFKSYNRKIYLDECMRADHQFNFNL